MLALKWEKFEQAQAVLRARCSSIQAKAFGLADDLAAVNLALGDIRQNIELLAAQHEQLSAELKRATKQ